MRPIRLLITPLFVLTAWSAVLAGGQTANDPRAPRDYRGVSTVVPGIFLTPASHAPFFGDVEILSHERLPDGTEHVTTARNHLARSSSGRIYQERHPMAPIAAQ